MDIKRIFRKDYTIGLDIGSSSIKIAQFVKKEDGLRLVKSEVKEIASSPASGEAPRNDAILSALKSLFRGIELKRSKVIAVIGCPKTALKIAKAPYMPKSELRDGINLEAKNYFPFPINDAILDYEILGDIVEKGIRKYEVAVSVSPKETVEKYLSLLGKAGIKPVSLVPYPYALQKIAERSDAEKYRTTCFVDIGELHTELVILKGKALVFSRKIPVTGADFTKAMTGVLVSDRGKTELSLDEAEKIKREVGIPDEEELKIIGDKISTTQILSMLRSPLEQLVSEIERCFDYYREETEGGKINSLVLFGGGASLRGFVKFLSGELGAEVKLGDPLEGLKIEPEGIRERDRISYRLELAIGAALTEGKGINLLPLEVRGETKRVIKRGTLVAVTTAVIFISILLYIGMKIQLWNFEKRISVAKMELASLRPQLEKAEAQHLANMILVNEPNWEDIFKELSNLIPQEIYLTDMRMEDGVITIEGIASSDLGERILSEFIATLEKGIFKSVKLVNIKDLKGQAGNEFEIKCWVE